MDSELERLHELVIVDHAKAPRGFGLVAGAAAESRQLNPTCGDEVTLQLHVSDGVVVAVTWEGHGCSISQASASLLSELANGLTVAELTERIGIFRELLRSGGTDVAGEDALGDAIVLQGVALYPARVTCAMLAWVAAEAALAQLA